MSGTRLGPWLLDRQLREDDAGVVWLAHAEPVPEDGPRRAEVRVFDRARLAPADDPERFQQGTEALGRLRHPSIPRLIGRGLAAEGRYLVYERAEGPTLRDVLAERGRLPWREVVDLAEALAAALGHAHERGVLHRDLSCDNVILGEGDDKPRVWLREFGVTGLLPQAPAGGTPPSLAPEGRLGQPLTRRSDLYALGVVLYELLTGRPPFAVGSVDALRFHEKGRPEPPSRLVPEVPAELDGLVLGLLEPDPARRPPDAGAVLRRLDGLRRKYRLPAAEPATQDPGARLMSRLMREELEAQNRGGWLRQLLRRPVVVVPLFLVCLGLLVWSFLPLSPESRYARGAALMGSADPDDWDRAWTEYLEPLQRRHPELHPKEMAAFKRKVDAAAAARKADRAARLVGPPSEAEWFYEQGLRLRQEGKEDEACRVWRALVTAFGEVPAEAPWVRLANRRLGEGPPPGDRDWAPLREAVARVRQLRAEGRGEEARRLREALRTLYAGDEAAEKELKALDAP